MADSRDYLDLRAMLVKSRVRWGSDEPNEQLVCEQVDTMIRATQYQVTPPERERLVRELLAEWDVNTDEGFALVDRGFTPWLTEERRQSITWHRGRAYYDYLINQGLPLNSVQANDEDSYNILGLLGDPDSDAFDRRGLILGDVQSGKTSSYLSVIGKAADAGYRLIVVLAGQTDRLRRQTQERVDEGFIGRRAAAALQPGGMVGIGLESGLPTVQSLTTANSDFSVAKLRGQNIAMDQGRGIFTVVLKKNKSVLETFGAWLADQDSKVIQEIPFLLLDDESDFASVNTRNRNNPELNPTAINNAIRKLLKTFTKKSYVAYTATPFANVFIDHSVNDDLFPRDFIYAIEAPSNYVGVDRVFGKPNDDYPHKIHEIDDASETFPLGHKRDVVFIQLPQSLTDALRAFALHNAIRDLRGQVNNPRSMLINVSRFKDAHSQLDLLVTEEWHQIKATIDAHAKRTSWSESPGISALNDTFVNYFVGCGFTWDQVRNQLANAVASVRIRVYNSAPNNQARDAESKSERVIAIGGAVLSRGVTLNGLGISYFYQAPRASDTLLQMGRWFGYRDGYEDLCHLWIDSQVALDFRRAYDSIIELRQDLRRMRNEGLTPQDFGFAVRHHPDALLITSQNKMQAAELAKRPMWAFAQLLETVKLDASVEVVDSNLAATRHLVERLLIERGVPERSETFIRWENIPCETIAEFLEDFIGSDEERPALDPHSLAAFTRRLGQSKFPVWDVAFSGPRDSSVEGWDAIPIDVPRRDRSCVLTKNGEVLLVSGRRARLAGATDVPGLLPEFQRRAIAAEWRKRSENGKTQTIPETEYYSGFLRPVLLMYMLRPMCEDLPAGLEQLGVVAAPKFVFPGKPYAKEGRPEEMFYLNSVAAERYLEQNYAFDSETDEDE